MSSTPTPVAPVQASPRPSRPSRARAALRAARGRLGQVPRPLAAILAAATVLFLAWSVAVPPFQGPDETAHFSYVQHLAEHGKPPYFDRGRASDSTEAGAGITWVNLRALRGVPAARPAWSEADQRQWEAIERDLPPTAQGDGDGPNAVGKNPPLYYAYQAIPYTVAAKASLFSRMFAMRMANLPIYLGTIALVWLLAAELLGAVWLRVVAAGAVALQPQYAFMGTVITPDALLPLIWTAFMLLAVRVVRHGPTAGRVIGISALATASLLTHGRGIAILPPAALAIALASWRHRPPLGAALRWTGAGVALLALSTLAYRALFVVSGGALYGGEVNIPTQSFSVRQLLSTIWQFYLPKLGSMNKRIGIDYGFRQFYVETFYGTFGSLEVVFSPRVYDLLQVASVGGLVALYTALVVRWPAVRRAWPVLLVLAATAGSMILLLHVASYRALLGTPGDPLIVGRYLMPLIALFGLAIAFVVDSLPRRLGAVAAGAVLAAGVLLQIGGLGLTLTRFYA